MFKKNIACILLVLLNLQVTTAQVSQQVKLPQKVKSGKLTNGLTYFIMHNKEPQDRVSFHFAQKVGSVLENEKQKGLAHFLEHMAFNGSENFKGREIDEMLGKKGLEFGGDFNAYTNFDETVYNIDNVPASDQELVEKCLLVLNDWSGKLSLEEQAIDDERGIILEEWRSRRTPQGLVNETFIPLLYKGSQYETRRPIGDIELVQNFEYQELRDFYSKWYRTDLQAVIIVGDIDVAEMEKKVIAQFSDIALSPNATKRPHFEIPDYPETEQAMILQEGLGIAQIDWVFRNEKIMEKGKDYLRKNIISQIFTNLLGQRYTELNENPETNIQQASIGQFNLGLNRKASYFNVVGKEGLLKEAFEEAYKELERVAQNGFLQSELDAEIAAFKQSYLNQIDNEIYRDNNSWASAISQFFLKNEPIQTATARKEFFDSIAPTINLEEVNAFAKQFKNVNNSLFTIKAPEAQKNSIPTTTELLALADTISNNTLEPYQNEVLEKPLLETELKPVAVKEVFSIPSVEEAKGYVLENGAKIVFMPSKKKGNFVSLNGFSFGGVSTVETADLISADKASELVKISGVGDFNALELSKKLRTNTADISFSLGEYEESVSGSSNISDFETLLQLCYLNFEKPRFNQALFEARNNESKKQLASMMSNKDFIFYDTLLRLSYNSNPRKILKTPEMYDNIDFETAKRIYKERFSGVGDFIFVVIGNLNESQALELTQKYIGNIKEGKSQENWKDRGIRKVNGTTKKVFSREMENPETTVYYELFENVDYNLENQLILEIIKSVLSTRYIDTIREEEGGSYGVSVNTNTSRLPEESFSLEINFKCNPAQQEGLVDIVKAEIANLKNNASQAYIAKAKENLLKNREESVLNDSYWGGAIANYLKYGEKIISDETYQKTLDGISSKQIGKFTKKYLGRAHSIELIMQPNQ